MTGRTHVDAVRAFVRNLNVVVKQVNMYGPAHKQVAPQLENTWKELRAALATDKVVLTAAGDHLLLAGKPLQAGSADRSFALLLVSAGIAGMCFLPDITQEQLEALVRLLANNKPPELLAQFKKKFGSRASIRLLEFHIGGEQQADTGLNLTGVLASAMLNNLQGATGNSTGKAASTNDLLRQALLSNLISQASGQAINSILGTGGVTPLNSGTFNIAGEIINFNRSGGQINITLTDPNGTQTQISVPVPTF